MTIQGVDYSFARPGGAALKAAGKVFAARYVPYQGDQGKGLTVAERDDLLANDIAIVLVFESTAGRPLGGRANGLVDGAIARQGSRSVGWPDDRPIYFAMDQDVTAADFPAIDAYLTACAESVQKVGIYGEFDVVEHCHDAGTATYFWQARAWSGGYQSQWRHIYQYLNGQTINGGAVDLDDGEGDDYGQWPLKEEGMTPEEKAKLDAVYAALTGGVDGVIEAWNKNGNSVLVAYNDLVFPHLSQPATPHHHATPSGFTGDPIA